MSPRIRVDPSLLRQSSKNVSGVGNNLSQVGGSVLGKASGAPSYDGQFGPRVQAIGYEALSRAQGLSGKMSTYSGQLQSRAQAFEAADLWMPPGSVLGSTTTKLSTASPLICAINSTKVAKSSVRNYSRLGQLASGGKYWKIGKETYEAGKGVYGSLKLTYLPGKTYPGQIVIKGAKKYHEMAKGPVNLRHVSSIGPSKLKVGGLNIRVSPNVSGLLGGAGIAKGMARAALKSSTKLGKLDYLEVGYKWGQDIHQYKDKGASKVTAAIAVDTALMVGKKVAARATGGVVGTYVGAVAGGAIGSLFSPVGTVIGAKIGGVLGNIAGSWAAETLIERGIEKTGIRDWAIDGAARGIKTAASYADRALSASVSKISKLKFW